MIIGRLWSAYFAGTKSVLAMFFVASGNPLLGLMFALVAVGLVMSAFLVHDGGKDV